MQEIFSPSIMHEHLSLKLWMYALSNNQSIAVDHASVWGGGVGLYKNLKYFYINNNFME
jgi:hypothetical protein